MNKSGEECRGEDSDQEREYDCGGGGGGKRREESGEETEEKRVRWEGIMY